MVSVPRGVGTEESLVLPHALLISTGSDKLLLSPGEEVEWTGCGLTSWYPGIGWGESSFRTVLERLYADFVEYGVPDAETPQARPETDPYDVAMSSILGDDQRADLLRMQVNLLRGGGFSLLFDGEIDRFEGDPTATEELWPCFVVSSLSSSDRWDTGDQDLDRFALDFALQRTTPAGARLRVLVEDYHRTGGLIIDFSYAPAFAAGVADARSLARAGRDEEAFRRLLAVLPHWRPRSGTHVAPIGLAFDRDLLEVLTPERCAVVLSVARGTG